MRNCMCAVCVCLLLSGKKELVASRISAGGQSVFVCNAIYHRCSSSCAYTIAPCALRNKQKMMNTKRMGNLSNAHRIPQRHNSMRIARRNKHFGIISWIYRLQHTPQYNVFCLFMIKPKTSLILYALAPERPCSAFL